MAEAPEEPDSSRHRRGGAAVAALTAAAGVLAVVAATSGCSPADSSESRATPTPEPVSPVGSAPTQPARSFRVVAKPAIPADSQLDAERPDAVLLPSGARVPVHVASTGRNGTLAVPDDISAAGWWDGGARIGDPFGAILIAGHVDSAVQGLGPFAELLAVGANERIVAESRNLRQTFAIRSVDLVAKGELVSQPGIFSVDGEQRLVLVTCAGPFDAARGGYQNLAVVTAIPLGRAEPH